MCCQIGNSNWVRLRDHGNLRDFELLAEWAEGPNFTLHWGIGRICSSQPLAGRSIVGLQYGNPFGRLPIDGAFLLFFISLVLALLELSLHI